MLSACGGDDTVTITVKWTDGKYEGVYYTLGIKKS